MAMRAVAHHCVKDVSLWTTQDLDEILHDGDRLYLSAAEAHDVTVLFPSEAIQTVVIEGRKVNLHVDNNRNGMLGSRDASLDEGAVTLQQTVEQIEHAAVFTSLGMSNEAVFEAVNVYASVEMTEDTVPLPHLRQFEDEDDIPLIRLKPGRQDEDENDVPMRHLEQEKRGKQSQRGNSKDSEKDEIRKHINSFARVESHYARKDSTREYLESSLSLLKMYELYVQKREKEGCKAPASETTYRYVFNREFNISFHKRMKDRCDICAAYENGYYDHTEEGEYKKHNQMKEDSRKFKDEVKARLKDDPSLAAAVFDLEEVLLTPSSVESCLYYKRKLNTYNLTVYDYRNGQGYCNVWAETASSRGSNEIASCVYRYLERISKEAGVKKVVLFSDSCGGQNRNKNFLTMLWYALTKFHFDEIEHVFFVSGHSQNEGDSMHSVIERMSRHVVVYTPSQWSQNMRTAKRHAPLYIVDELVQSDFFDFKKVAELLKNFQLDTQKEKVRWLDVKRFKLSSQEPNVVDVGYDYTGDYCQLNLVRKLRAVHSIPDPADIVLENVSKAPLPITKEKYNDLVNLCERYIIPKAHHHYFRSLPHDA
ncbi:uncharacterized protein [Littorina saxatilis]|uniref:uncharacterized protein n=1 Tax=Littorina saxatilis TaxID=31220 RepID=UPI0038B4EF92